MEQNAAQYLRQKIADLKASQKNIAASIANMQTIHDVQEIEIAALENALKDLPTHDAEPTPATPYGNGMDKQIVNLGFRDAVRYVLAHADKGLKPKDIAEDLLARGYPYTGSVHIGTRVSNELHRMKKSGGVRKRGSLYYAAKESDE